MSILGWIIGGIIVDTLLSDDKTEENKDAKQAEPTKDIQEQKVEVPQVIDEDDDFIENLIKESQDQLNNIDDIL